MRQHVNPLSRRFHKLIEPPRWTEIFVDPGRPLLLDVGSGRGEFLLEMARRQTEWNHLGLEVRLPFVEEANALAAGLGNLHFLYGSANLALEPLLSSLPAGSLQRVAIQYPDPWYKRRQHKRRVVQPALVDVLARHLPPGGEVFLQSDVEELAREMVRRFASHGAFGTAEWLSENPLPIPTDRETVCLAAGLPVHRALLRRR